MTSADPTDASALRDWAASGAMALTGRPDGPPIAPPGRAASILREHIEWLGLTELGHLLGERAALAGLHRNGPLSCGGAFRILPSFDGFVGISLSRPTDLELVPALVQADVDDPWTAVSEWAARTLAHDVEQRLLMLGIPGGSVPSTADRRPGVVTTPLGSRQIRENPVVVDLTSMWAGPLCARILSARGARIIKVESTTRPDGARRGSPEFFDLLHAGHEQVEFDFATQVEELKALIEAADLVLEASRPRALKQLGICAEDVVAAGTSWLSITARGRQSDAVGFGDDVAACAGLFVADGNDLLPVGDAIADPYTGVSAAVAASQALSSGHSVLIDVSMLDLARESLDGWSGHPAHAVSQREGRWWVDTAQESFAIDEPRAHQ